MRLFSRSKSRSRQPDFTSGTQLPPQPSHYLNTPAQTGVPLYRQRSNSLVAAVAVVPGQGVFYAPPADHQQYQQQQQQSRGGVMAGYSPQMMQHPGHYFAQGHVVYHHIPQKSGYDSSPQSHYLDSHARGRPRSNTSTAGREKPLISSNPVRVPLAGYVPAPTSHEGSQKSGGIFGSLVNAVRSRSKSRERDALFSASSYAAQGERGRPVYDLKRQKEMLRDVDAELSRRLEKDLRLQDLEDPYRPLRARSRSFESTRSRERAERRNRDIDPDVQDNTRYNAKALAYAPERPTPVTRVRSDEHRGGSSGYHTDAQPSMLRRNSTTTAHHPKSHRSSHAPPPKGWFNSRGDQLVNHNSVIRQPAGREYQPCFAHYPPPGQGFADSAGNVIDMEGRLVKRVG